MAHKGLTKERIIDEAVFIIQENGFEHFSMRELAERLEIKTASLYNHVQNIDELYGEAGLRASKCMGTALCKSIEGENRESAVMKLAFAYRRFVKDHAPLYQAILYLPRAGKKYMQEASPFLFTPIMQMLSSYRLNEEQKLHLQRIFRAVAHGFLSQEKAGFFSQASLNCEESYRIAILGFIGQLEKMEE